MKKLILGIAIVGTLLMTGCGSHDDVSNPNEISDEEMNQMFGDVDKTQKELEKHNVENYSGSYEYKNDHKCYSYDWNKRIYVRDNTSECSE